MSNPKKSDDFLKGGVISEEAMLAYLNNTLSAEEKQQFEKLLAEDPFAQDALEGLQAAQSKTAVTASIAKVRHKVRERSGIAEKKIIRIHWTNYAWAAALMGLLIGIGFLMVNYMGKNEGQLAQNKPATSQDGKPIFDEAPVEQKLEPAGGVTASDSGSLGLSGGTYTVSVTDANGAVATEQQSGAGKMLEQPAQNPVMAAPPVADVSIKSLRSDSAVFYANSPASGMNSTLSADRNDGVTNGAGSTYAWTPGTNNEASNAKSDQNVIVSGSKTEKDAGLKKNFKAKVPQYDETVTAYDDVKGKVSAENLEEIKTKESAKETTMDDAMKSFNSGDYKKAAEQFDVLLKKEPENPDALYFGGISDYVNGKANKSEKNFDKLLNDGKRYQDGSKWYKANILLKKGKTEEAKKLLEELSNATTSYKERAVKKLEELK